MLFFLPHLRIINNLMIILTMSNFLFVCQCASAVDNLAAFYFNNITMGEAPTSTAAINLARNLAECPRLLPEVSDDSS